VNQARVINKIEYLLETGKKLEEEEDESGGKKTTLITIEISTKKTQHQMIGPNW
jgi:CYTH domain-containing protein